MRDQSLRMGRQGVEAAYADGEVAERPGVRQAYRADRHRASAPGGRGRGDHAETDAMLHEPADRLEAAQADPEFERLPGPGRNRLRAAGRAAARLLRGGLRGRRRVPAGMALRRSGRRGVVVSAGELRRGDRRRLA